jgi:DnaJ-domain-containing protein 1
VALLRILLLAAVVLFITRWLRRRLAGHRPGSGELSGRRGGFGPRQTESKTRAKLRMLRFEKAPHDVLGVDKRATREQIDAARTAALEKNDPDRLEDMSAEIREVAERRRKEIKRAYQQLIGEE